MLSVASVSAAQQDVLFGTGKPVEFTEQDLDRKFQRSRVARALTEGTSDARCVQLLGGLLTALAEAAPTFHTRDENFLLDPHLLHAVNTQLTNPRFPGNSYLGAMVRRVLIDRKLPDDWMSSAERINPALKIIDMGKLRFLQEGLQPIDSFYFTLPALRERYELEVLRANSISKVDAHSEFRDSYLDRNIAWGDLRLVDIGAPKYRAKKKKKAAESAPEPMVALLHWTPPEPPQTNPLMLFTKKKPRPVKIFAKLAPTQYLDLTKLPKGKRLLVKGRFWEMNKAANEFEVREALLFEDRDWSQGAVLADPQAVLACPFAFNDLTGSAPRQPGGFGHR